MFGGLTMIVLTGLSTLAVLALTIWDLLPWPRPGGQPVALWIAYTPFPLPFGFHLG